MTTTWRITTSFLILIGLTSPLPAEEINWRTDYNQARKEAKEQNKPLVIDFTTENCIWCQQLDVRTFAQPDVIALVNEKFIPLKVHAPTTPQLVTALNIQFFPTILYAGPSGKILGYQEGFLEAPNFRQQLQKVVGVVHELIEPEWMQRDQQLALEAVASGEYSQAIELLKKIVANDRRHPTQIQASTLLAQLETQAEDRLREARLLVDRGEREKADKILEDLSLNYAGTVAAGQGEQLQGTLASRSRPSPSDPRLSPPPIPTPVPPPSVSPMPIDDEKRQERARELWERAQQDFDAQQYLCCLDRCEILTSRYSDLPEGKEASELATKIKTDVRLTRLAADQLSVRLGVLYLSLAESWLKKGQPQQAVFYLEKVVQILPDTSHAEVALIRLAQIQGKPTPKPSDE